MKWLPEQITTTYTDCTHCYAAVKSSLFLTAGHILNTLSKKKRGPVGVASFFCIHQSHTDSPLYRSHLLHSISQSLTLLFGFDGHVCYNHILYNRTKWMFECKSDSAGWIYLSNGHHVLPTCFFLCYPSINIIPCSDTGILLDIINLWCSVHFCNFFFGDELL